MSSELTALYLRDSVLILKKVPNFGAPTASYMAKRSGGKPFLLRSVNGDHHTIHPGTNFVTIFGRFDAFSYRAT